MNHPTSAELIDLQRGELTPDRAQTVREHIKVCDRCREEWEALNRLEEQITDWQARAVSETFVEEAMDVIALEQASSGIDVPGRPNTGTSERPWLRRLTLAAGAVAASLLFQAIVWNPLGGPITFRAIFDFTPAAIALPAGQAVPDTILVLTLHPDETLSTSLLEGRFNIEDLIEELTPIVEIGSIKRVLLVGGDPEHPTTFRLDELQPLLDELEISELKVGGGVVGLEVEGGVVARVSVPSRVRLRPAISVISRADSIRHYIELELTPKRLEVKPIIRLVRPHVRVSIMEDSLRTYVITDTSRTVITGEVRYESAAESAVEVMLDSLISASRVCLTVTSDGIVLMNRAAIQLDEIEGALLKLKEHDDDISILIIIPKGGGSDDPGYDIVDIANRLGIKRIAVKKVEDPPGDL